MKRNSPKTIVLGVSASIAAYKSLDLVSVFKKEGLDVIVVMTKDSQNFVGALSFQSLSGNAVCSDMFVPAAVWQNEHISLADKADLVLVCPATCDVIAKVANGICDDLLGCIICATKRPVIFAPAMNDNMYNNKITQENIRKLKSLGYHFVGPRFGRLACGKEAIGCLEEPDKIFKAVKQVLK
jgi:phosphopantothenoylcysteine decarboxylase / phosphopantothenate---cysteine ligase